MKNSLKRVCAALAVSAVAVSATSVVASAYDGSAFNPEQYGITAEEIANAPIKPTVSMDKVEIELKDALNTQTVKMSVKDTQNLYSSFGFHIVYDTRLTPVKNEDGEFFTRGDATVKILPEERDLGEGQLFISGMSTRNGGKDGVMFELQFDLPKLTDEEGKLVLDKDGNAQTACKEGDIFPIGFVYNSTEATEDQFVGTPNNHDSLLMQGWVFTQGIEDGYIKIKEAPTTTTEETTESTTTEETTTTNEETTTTTGASPATGVEGVGVAAAGLAVAIGTAFVLRKKED